MTKIVPGGPVPPALELSIMVVTLDGGLLVVCMFYPLAITVHPKWIKATSRVTYIRIVLQNNGEVLPQQPSSWYLETEEASFELFIYLSYMTFQ